MPTPKKGESEKDFVSRCIPYVKDEDPSISNDHAAAKCHGIYRQHRAEASDNLDMDALEVLTANGDSETQTLVMAKSRFKTRESAKTWAKDHGFKTKTIRETTNHYRLRQRPPGDFDQSSFKITRLTNGVQAVIGKVR